MMGIKCKHCGGEIDYVYDKNHEKIYYHREFKNFTCGKMVYLNTKAEPNERDKNL